MLLVSIEMGYGHLRAAHALSAALDTPVLNADQPPLADHDEQQQWSRARTAYEFVSRSSQLPLVGGPFALALGALTAIPQLYPRRDLSAATLPVRYLARNARRGLGRGMVARLARTREALLTTFYAPAVIADLAGCERVYCVVTDADVNRVWVGPDVRRSRVTYLVPGHRTARRLRAYGVAPDRIVLTGFPLPPQLLGGPALPVLKRDLAARLGRLDPTGAFGDAAGAEVAHVLGVAPPRGPSPPPLVTFAVGGAGTQAGLPARFLPGFRQAIEARRLRLALVAGVRAEVAATLTRAVQAAGLETHLGGAVRILHTPAIADYFPAFNALLAETDVLWTKPSELTFFGALGLPLVFAPPVGRHEAYNLRWARECGVGLEQGDPASMAERLLDWLEDGALAGAAWSGFMRMPKYGTYRIADIVSQAEAELSPDRQPRSTSSL
jgi:hypothetical protein